MEHTSIFIMSMDKISKKKLNIRISKTI